MIYYSTGKSSYLPAKGKPVETNNESTVKILLKNGSIVESLNEFKEETIKEKHKVVKPKKK
jgi:hypothetical protein